MSPTKENPPALAPDTHPGSQENTPPIDCMAARWQRSAEGNTQMVKPSAVEYVVSPDLSHQSGADGPETHVQKTAEGSRAQP